ncbi:dinitrogenase iron-molybdenum cofactor [Halanaerobium saccharolyticum]|jgi:predicted Fe-Mo cluster-binding NifX family protein|uniref:Dinitrogenase iron-molybdenum cofactor n=1 Tax=Halanaerobium saccharolyticum TaxID=43595 RepID=A0A2T5RHY7_9FIRM|nr:MULTISPECIES: NifB/NifX family molybdenum-iron cluster-binding protein [Halanaerobium]PTV97750.1 dinitrogenase iron-molybdenum cofactor [Halanaerobium saccharolyticum]PUU94027.1 MAG: dinitrogenase iron-molybdenum cofactor biosynthesis protein [Halanaerobium sp.]
MNLKVALATNDGKTFVSSHFGEANEYYIYDIDSKNYQYLKSAANNSTEEKMHADPKKAKSIIKILEKEGVQIVCNLAFGANIKRVKKKLVPVITSKTNLNDGLEELVANYDQLLELWNKGEERDYLNLTKN